MYVCVCVCVCVREASPDLNIYNIYIVFLSNLDISYYTQTHTHTNIHQSLTTYKAEISRKEK
jgi:hypothetical protein